MADAEGIVVQARSRLLDFCLELQGVVGVEAKPGQLQEKAAAIDAGKMFRMAIFNKGGTVIVGIDNPLSPSRKQGATCV